jgi:hypothetical protein
VAVVSPAQLTPDAQQIKSTLDRLARAQAEVTASGIALLNVAHAIGNDAVNAFKDDLVESLVQDTLLQDLEQMRAAAPPIPLPADLKLLPEATLNWLCRHLDLSPHLHQGQELEVPTTRLDQYDLQGSPPNPVGPLVKLRVLAPGWKRRDLPVIRPRVVLTIPSSAECPAASPGVPRL